DVLGNRAVHQEAFLASVLGDEGDAAADAGARRARRQPAALDADFAGLVTVEAEEDAGEFGAPGAHQSEDAEHFAAMERETHVPDDAGRAEADGFEQDRGLRR